MKKINAIIILLLFLGLAVTPAFAKNDKSKGKSLPPGLQKKVAKGEQLPPGWQKKLIKGEIMEYDVYRRSSIVVPLDPHGLVTVRIEGKLIRLYKATREIVEILN
jgi:hypothetical protein